MTLTLEMAETLVRHYWQLPPGSETLESARLGMVMERIIRGLPYDCWEPLRFRLTGRRRGHYAQASLIVLLTQAVDRRTKRNPPLPAPAVERRAS